MKNELHKEHNRTKCCKKTAKCLKSPTIPTIRKSRIHRKGQGFYQETQKLIGKTDRWVFAFFVETLHFEGQGAILCLEKKRIFEGKTDSFSKESMG